MGPVLPPPGTFGTPRGFYRLVGPGAEADTAFPIVRQSSAQEEVPRRRYPGWQTEASPHGKGKSDALLKAPGLSLGPRRARAQVTDP